MIRTTVAPRAPRSVEIAYSMVLVALFAGAAEAVLRAIADPEADVPTAAILTEFALRAALYLCVAGVAVRMRAGASWARTTLVLGLGTVGLGSLLAEPLAAILSANGFTDLFSDIGTDSAVFGALRAVHVAAVLGALGALWRRDARRYFLQ